MIPLRLPSKQEAVAAVILGLSALLYMARQEIRVLRATLAARPEVHERVETDRTEDVRRGPVKITRRTETKPDGTKVTEQVREIASEERKIVASTDTTRDEKPAPLPPARTRYAGLALDPFDARRPRVRGGLTLFDSFDAGLAYDSRFPILRGALQAELTYRF